MRRVLAMLVVAILSTACGSTIEDDAAKISDAESPGTVNTTAPPVTAATQTLAEWVRPALLPYGADLAKAFDDVSTAANAMNLAGVKAGSQRIADAARGFRLALQASGPVPRIAAVEGAALIESTSELEHAARAAAACVSIGDCTSRISTAAAAMTSWNSAVNAVSARVTAGR